MPTAPCRAAFVATVLLACFPGIRAAAQSEPAPAQPAPAASPEPETGFFETIDVNVVNVDVYVTDKKGKHVEDLTEGDYAPSPGIVYPTLTMLEDMGHIREQKSKDSKKVFEATDDGRAHLEENEEEVEELFEKLEGHGRTRRHGQRPEIGRAVGNLMTALRNRVAAEGWHEELLEEVVDILDDAAQRIERAKKARSKDDEDED